MNILLAFYPIDDMGGIINHNEQLALGLELLGHDVTSKIFLPRANLPRNGVAGGKASISKHSGMLYDQRRGYTWPNELCVPYRGYSLESAQRELAKYDLVIWQVAVPTKRKENKGNSDWVRLYGHAAREYAVIHDGNFLDSYPWLWKVSKHIDKLICVHHCAYESAKYIDIPRQLVFNPQEIDLEHTQRQVDNFANKRKGFLSLQTFKAWKHVPELVRAIPHTSGIECNLAGKGIDYYYLTSKDKCKWPGVWDSAVESGMLYHDVITNEQRDTMLQGLTCLVDPSWSKKYAAIGGHFNRVVIDGIKQGCIPIVRPFGIGTDESGFGELFEDRVNCLVINQNATPELYGQRLTEFCNISEAEYKDIMANCMHLLPEFDRINVASRIVGGAGQQFFSAGTKRSHDTINKSDKVFNEFFCAEV
jgi:glycosyltransferase involved in cell wall biosynthesis